MYLELNELPSQRDNCQRSRDEQWLRTPTSENIAKRKSTTRAADANDDLASLSVPSFHEAKERSDKTLWRAIEPRGRRDPLQWPDVLVHAEEVCRVVLGFQGDEAIIVVAIGGLESVVISIV